MRRTAVLGLMLVGACVVQAPAVPSHAEPAPDLPALQAQLSAATARAEQLADDLTAAQARDGGLRRAVDDLQIAHEKAQARLDARVREVYISSAPRELDAWTRLTDPGRGALVARGVSASVRVGQDLVDDAAGRSAQAIALRAEADRSRAALSAQSAGVLAEQDRARELLDQARRLVAQQAAAQQQAERQRAADRQAAETAQLNAAQTALDAVSAAVTTALAPPPTARGRRAAEAEEPVIALLEAAGSGYPAGYAPTGGVISGTASWYGPGFVGSPTASGRPYDPERPTCAHKTLPLGTVLHVSANGRSTNCLVDDRGPYVGDRVLDMSRAGSRALGYDGTAEVVAEVLAPNP